MCDQQLRLPTVYHQYVLLNFKFPFFVRRWDWCISFSNDLRMSFGQILCGVAVLRSIAFFFAHLTLLILAWLMLERLWYYYSCRLSHGIAPYGSCNLVVYNCQNRGLYQTHIKPYFPRASVVLYCLRSRGGLYRYLRSAYTLTGRTVVLVLFFPELSFRCKYSISSRYIILLA